MGGVMLTTAMFNRISHHACCFSPRRESYRLKRSDAFDSAR